MEAFVENNRKGAVDNDPYRANDLGLSLGVNRSIDGSSTAATVKVQVRRQLKLRTCSMCAVYQLCSRNKYIPASHTVHRALQHPVRAAMTGERVETLMSVETKFSKTFIHGHFIARIKQEN